MHIAGVHFKLSSGLQLPRPENIPANYRHFRAQAGIRLDEIGVRLELNHFPDTAGMTRIFDSVQSWALFRDGDDYVLEYKPPAFQRPLWVSRFDRGFQQATVHCGNLMTSEEHGELTVRNPLVYPLDQLLLMHLLSRRGGAIIHAAGMALKGRGYMFPGRSGAGKSTLSRLLRGSEDIEMLSDDRVVARRVGARFEVFGTPWAGDAGIAENKNFPLSGIFFIHHAEENAIRAVEPKTAFERLMPVTSIPWYERESMSGTLSFCEDLVLNVPAYELHFRPDRGVAGVLEKFISP